MGLVMSPGSVITQLDEMNQKLSRTTENAEEALRRIKKLEDSGDDLKGEAYDSVRDYFGSVHIPVLHGLIMYAEELIQENYQYQMAIASNLAGIGYVDEDALRRDLEELQRQMECLRAIMSRKGYPSSVDGMLGSLEEAKRLIEKKLDQIEDFLGSTGGLYGGLDAYAGSLKSGIECMNTAVICGNQMVYKIDPLDREWAAELESRWIQKEVKEKELFVNAMTREFGFDGETAGLIYKLYDRMEQEGIENLNQKYFALLASCVYSNSANVSIKNTVWQEIAGTCDEEEFNKILKGYGFTEEEIKGLEHDIKENYRCSQLGNETDAGSYYNKNDLSHISVICATMLNDNGVILNTAGGFAGWFCNGIFNLEANAGYVGDVFGTAGNGAKLTQDDYKADLDAVNLCSRLEVCGNGIKVIGQYYEGIANGEINRANEFVINLGGGDYENGIAYLQEQIDSNRSFQKNAGMGLFREMGLEASVNIIKGGGLSLAQDIYAEKMKIQRNFFRSLLEGSNEYLETEKVNIDLAERGKR